ncbi:polysaccharide lyase 8 family protein [Paenibacillus albidus]|uniref:polysaccharide lyase 8 family protein n=1 Tax=Paenibacillus albidus TaxID=2041023 RepID=UPI001BE9B3B3|nr:polysaccharide lyase 8 family protein [Paenibacillus albidus]MBT2289693.1 polysaccharide lyase 8 family protein [Paenibacillus albidus]
MYLKNGTIRKTGVTLFAALIWLTALLPAGGASAESPDEFDQLRDKWHLVLTGGPGASADDSDIAAKRLEVNTKAQNYWTDLSKEADRTCLWSDLCSTNNSSHITDSYTRIKDMAIAYETPGTSLEGNPALLTDMLSALDWLHTNRYNQTAATYNNWWDWEIGTPLRLNDIMVLLYDELGSARRTNYAAAIERFSPVVEMTGANRVWKVTVVAVRGVVVKDAAKLAAASGGLSEVFSYVAAGDGFYADGSFIQHDKYAYTGGYGLSLISDIANILYLLGDSSWEPSDPKLGHVYRWVHEAVEPFLYKGAFMDMTRGREISRAAYQDHYAGNRAVQAILMLAETAPATQAATLKSLAKEMIAADTYYPFYTHSSMFRILMAKELMNDPGVAARGALSLNHTFAGMDRTVHLGGSFGFGISMSSSRVYNFESINGENLKGWFTGDGATYLYNNDLSHYSNDYWATVDPYRLAGTTLDTNPRLNSSGYGYLGSTSWTGGASLGGVYGAAGMELDAWGNSLTARKSWFMFDKEIIALGSGISSTDNRPIVTNVENRKLNASGSNTFTVNGVVQPSASGAAQSHANVQWAHLAGSVAGADIGYYFPGGAAIESQRSTRTGSWQDINQSGPHAPITRSYLSMRVNHGVSPTNGTYAYALLPGATSTQAADYAANPGFTVLSRTGAVHAVRDHSLQLTGANFWTASGGSAGGITSSGQASVLLKASADELNIAVSDPTMSAADFLIIDLDQPVTSKLSASPGVYVTRFAPAARLYVDVRGAKGESFEAKLSLTAPPSGPGTGLDAVPDSSGRLFYDSFKYGTSEKWQPETVAASGTVPACGPAQWHVVRNSSGSFTYGPNQPAGECRSLIKGPGWTDYAIEARMQVSSLAAGSSAPNLIARYVNAQNYYRFGFSSTDSSGNGQWKIYKRAAGTWTVIATGPNTQLTAGQTCRIKTEVLGTQLKLYVDNGSGYTLQTSATDTSHPSGRAGLLTYKADSRLQEIQIRQLP